MKVGVKFWNCTKVLVPQKRYVAQVFPELRLDFNLQQLVPKQDPTVPAHELSNLSASGISRPISLGPGHRKASSGRGPRLSWKARSLEEISTRRLPVPKGVWGDSGAEAEGVHMVQGVGYTLPLMSLLFRSLKTSSRVLPASGSFLNFSLSRMDNSLREGQHLLQHCGQDIRAGHQAEDEVLDHTLLQQYIVLHSWETTHSMTWMVALVCRKRLMNLM